MCGVINSFKSWRHFTFSLINCWKFACQTWQHLQTQDAQSHSLFNKCARSLAQAWRGVSVLNHFIKSSVVRDVLKAVLVSTAVTEGDRGCVQSIFLRVTTPTNKVLFWVFCLFLSFFLCFPLFFFPECDSEAFLIRSSQLWNTEILSCGLEGGTKREVAAVFSHCGLTPDICEVITLCDLQILPMNSAAVLWSVWSLASLLFAPCTHRDFKSHLRLFVMQLLLAMVFLVMRAQCSEGILSDVFW